MLEGVRFLERKKKTIQKENVFFYTVNVIKNVKFQPFEKELSQIGSFRVESLQTPKFSVFFTCWHVIKNVGLKTFETSLAY